MHLEGELVRAHSKVQGCPHPPTVCQYITEQLRGWQSCVGSDTLESNVRPCQEDKQEGVSGSGGGAEEERRRKLLHSCVVDVWDKAYAVKVVATYIACVQAQPVNPFQWSCVQWPWRR